MFVTKISINNTKKIYLSCLLSAIIFIILCKNATVAITIWLTVKKYSYLKRRWSFSSLYHYLDFDRTWMYIWVTGWVAYVSTWLHPQLFGRVGVDHLFSGFVLSYYAFLVPCCNVRYDIRMKTMFGSSLPFVVCSRVHVLFM